MRRVDLRASRCLPRFVQDMDCRRRPKGGGRSELLGLALGPCADDDPACVLTGVDVPVRAVDLVVLSVGGSGVSTGAVALRGSYRFGMGRECDATGERQDKQRRQGEPPNESIAIHNRVPFYPRRGARRHGVVIAGSSTVRRLRSWVCRRRDSRTVMPVTFLALHVDRPGALDSGLDRPLRGCSPSYGTHFESGGCVR